MKKTIIAILFILIIPSNAYAITDESVSTKACLKVNQTKTINKIKYSCQLSGKKLTWQPLNSKPKTTNFEFTSTCQIDPNTPAEWAELEKLNYKNSCASFYKYVPYKISGSPKTSFDANSGSIDIQQCKIKQPTGQYYPWRGFASPDNGQMVNYFNSRTSPKPNMKIQAIPLSWSEYPDSSNPKDVYEKYFIFLKKYIENMSDNGSNVTFDIPDKYFQMPKPLAAYKDIEYHGHPTPNKTIFWNDAILASDPGINFSGVSVSVIIVTPNTPIDKFGGNPDGNGISSEGPLNSIITLPPFNVKDQHRNTVFLSPQLMIHELTHAGLDMGDYHSTGIWSHVGDGHFDYLGWDRYISGFMSDDQVHCVDPNQSSTRLIAPLVAKGSLKKLIVVPISASKVLVIESVRSAGYKYKLPTKFEGALVYTVDVSMTAHGEGTYILKTNSRKSVAHGPNDKLIDAPLRAKENLIFENIKISIIESGSFGDVVKVEKI